MVFQNGIRVSPDILVSIYGQVLGSNLHFQNTEKLSEGEETRVMQTRGSGFSRYRLMVNYQVFYMGRTRLLCC